MADSDFVDDQQLRQELLKFDVTISKITDKNREILIKKLNHLRARQRAAEAPPSPSRSRARQSPGRGKKSPPRRSNAPTEFHFSSSDEDVSASTETNNVTQRQKNLRRRTVDSGSMKSELHDETGTRASTRGATADVEPVSAGKSNRRSFGATTNSPFLAGSLRNPVLSQSPTESGSRLRSGRVNDSLYDGGEISDSDNESSFVEMVSSGVNTSASLYNRADTSSSRVGDLRGQQGQSKLQTGGTSGKN